MKLMKGLYIRLLLLVATWNVLYARSFSVKESASTAKSSIWRDVEGGPPDAILGIAQAFRECTAENKLNVCVGAYRDEKGSPWVLPTVLKAEESILKQQKQGKMNKEYLPIEGDSDFTNLALKFAYGSEVDVQNCVAGVQSLSGTGACRIGGHFCAQFLPGRTIYIPTPTWGNHWKIFQNAGLDTKPYRYYDYSNNKLDLDGLLQDIQDAPKGSIILLHACAHNPTGCDPTNEEWKQIVDIIKEKQHVCFFDSAYQGFASGDAEHDAWALRYFVEQETIPVMLAQSFAKNFGLYGERCGTFSVVCSNKLEKDNILSQLKCIIRPMYSSPPRHGSSIVKTVLSDEKLTAQYYKECQHMAERIGGMRQKLVDALQKAGSTHDWSHITSQIGMFAYTGMNSDMCDALTEKYNIFLTRDGRISLAGLNDDNLDYVAQAIHDVTDGKKITL